MLPPPTHVCWKSPCLNRISFFNFNVFFVTTPHAPVYPAHPERLLPGGSAPRGGLACRGRHYVARKSRKKGVEGKKRLKLANAPPATQPFLFGHFIKGMVGFSCFPLHSNVFLGNASQAKRLTGCVSRLLAVFALDPFTSSCWGASWGSRRVR